MHYVYILHWILHCRCFVAVIIPLSPLWQHVCRTPPEFKRHISICISCDTVLALTSPRVASRVPGRIGFLHCICNGNHTRERRRKEQNRGSEGEKKGEGER